MIDDGSTDGTVVRAREAGTTVIEHEHNRGYGAALRTAFEEGNRRNADHLVVLDGDGQHDPADIPRLVAKQERGDAEKVIGSRFVDGREDTIPLYRRLGIRAINLLTNVSFGTMSAGLRISDTQSGFRAYDTRAIRSLATTPSGPE